VRSGLATACVLFIKTRARPATHAVLIFPSPLLLLDNLPTFSCCGTSQILTDLRSLWQKRIFQGPAAPLDFTPQHPLTSKSLSLTQLSCLSRRTRSMFSRELSPRGGSRAQRIRAKVVSIGSCFLFRYGEGCATSFLVSLKLVRALITGNLTRSSFLSYIWLVKF
jgi:hypothetical protein